MKSRSHTNTDLYQSPHLKSLEYLQEQHDFYAAHGYEGIAQVYENMISRQPDARSAHPRPAPRQPEQPHLNPAQLSTTPPRLVTHG